MSPSLFRLKSWLRIGVSLAYVAQVVSSQFIIAAIPQSQHTGDLITKWRGDTSDTHEVLSVSEAGNRLLSVTQAAGSTLQVKCTLGTNTQLIHTGPTDTVSIQATIGKTAEDARVTCVVPDRILRPDTVPNDPLFATQSNLAVPVLVSGGTNAAAAWSITQGSTSIVVAVVDTGCTGHSNLSPKTLPGYNFILDPVRANSSFDRGTDTHDLGDIVTSADAPGILGYTISDTSNPSASN